MINESLSKSELRTFYKNERNSLKKDEISKLSKIITKNVISYLDKIDFKNVFIYLSFSSEVKTGDIIEYLIKNNKKIYVPKCDVKSETMFATVYNSEKTANRNIYGIQELDSEISIGENYDIIIMPGICFDRFGNRIGFGKGYYDKFISEQKNKPLLLAIAYDNQIYDGIIETNEFDKKIDTLITQSQTIIFNRG